MDIVNLVIIEYGMIIGRDLMKSSGLIIDFKHKALYWDDITVPMNMIELNNNKEFNCNL